MEISFTQPSPTLQPADTTVGMSHEAQIRVEIEKISALVIALDAKVNILLENSEKARRSASRSFWLTMIFVVLPIALSIFAIPYLMKTLSSSMGIDAGQGASIQEALQTLQSLQKMQEE